MKNMFTTMPGGHFTPAVLGGGGGNAPGKNVFFMQFMASKYKKVV
jgi:hypothetical protein